jgi:hypothetical protein
VPATIFDPNIFTMSSGHSALDLDIVNSTCFFFAGNHGLSRALRNAVTRAWSYTSVTTRTGLK